MHEIKVDEEVYGKIQFGCLLTGWTPSQVIKRLAAIRLEEAKKVVDDLAELAAGAPVPIFPNVIDLIGKDVELFAAQQSVPVQAEESVPVQAKKPAPIERIEVPPQPMKIEHGHTHGADRVPRGTPPSTRELHRMILDGALSVDEKFTVTFSGSDKVWTIKVSDRGNFTYRGREYNSLTGMLKELSGVAQPQAWGIVKDSNGTSVRDLVRAWRESKEQKERATDGE